jgi:hypothetical protein
LLSEEVRRKAVKKIIELSEQEHSCRFACSHEIVDIFTAEEERSAIMSISKNLLEEGEYILDNIKDSWDRESDPGELFVEIYKTLAFIESDERFDEESQDNAAHLQYEIERLIQELAEKQLDGSGYEKLDTEEAVEVASPTARSVFDDVDQ